MEKLTSVLAALEAGKLPSQDQTNQAIAWFNKSFITQVEPTDEGDLSSQGHVLADAVGDILEAYKALGSNKNGDNVLQEAIWHITKGDVTTSADIANVDEALSDLKAMQVALRILLKTIWSSATSEGVSFLQDFASFARLALADAAQVIEGQAVRVKEGLRRVEGEVQSGERDSLGRNKQRVEEEKDVKIKFEHGMDTLKQTGSTIIGAGQTTKASAERGTDKARTTVRDMYYSICDGAQNDPAYHSALVTLFDIVQKWLTKTLDSASDVTQSMTLDSFIHDPTPDQHVPKALYCVATLIERLAGNKSLDDLFAKIRMCSVDVRQDQDLKNWFEELFDYLRRSLDEPGYARSDESKNKHNELCTKWKVLLDEDSETGKKWKADIGELKAEIKAFVKGIADDQDLNRVREAHAMLGSRIESGLRKAGAEAEMGLQAAVEQGSWFWRDLFRVFVPRALSMLKDIPIPRTEYKDADIELVLENLDISSFNLLPSHVYIRNITDIDISTSKTSSRTAVGALTHIRVQAMQLTLKDVSFWFKDKKAAIGPSEVTGLMAFTLPEKGVDIDVKVLLIPATPPDAKKPGERETRGAFHIVEKVAVSIAEDVNIQVKESNHAVMLSVFKPIFVMRLRDALERTMTEQIHSSIEWADSVAWDVSRRAEVFEDAGMGKGSALSCAMWSEVGRLQKMYLGRGSWKATGTGVVREGEGEGKERAEFAIGAEPQILSGEKRGPMGTGSESISGQAGETVAATKGKRQEIGEAVGQVREDIKAQVGHAEKQVKTFKQSVDVKAQKERKTEGWQSDAFDLAT